MHVGGRMSFVLPEASGGGAADAGVEGLLRAGGAYPPSPPALNLRSNEAVLCMSLCYSD